MSLARRCRYNRYLPTISVVNIFSAFTQKCHTVAAIVRCRWSEIAIKLLYIYINISGPPVAEFGDRDRRVRSPSSPGPVTVALNFTLASPCEGISWCIDETSKSLNPTFIAAVSTSLHPRNIRACECVWVCACECVVIYSLAYEC